MDSNNFLKWISITSIALITLAVGEFKYGAFSTLAAADITYICYGIMLLGFTAIVFSFRQVMQKNYHMKKLTDLSYVAQMLGLLGTVIGMSFLFASLSTIEDETIRQDLITTGMSTVLNTTIIGVVCSLMIYTYVIFLREDQ